MILRRSERRALWLASSLAASAIAAVAQGCGGDDQPGLLGNAHDGGATSDATGGNDGAPPADGAVPDGAKSEGGADANPDAKVDAGPAVCDPGATWSAGTPVLTTAAADSAMFGGITPDEITMTWTTVTGGVATVWYADRPAKGLPFGTPRTLASMFGAVAADRASVSQDGLRIVAIASGGNGFVTATRMTRATAFDANNPNEFTPLLPGPDSDAGPSSFAAPLYAPSDQWFLYVLTSSFDDHVILQSRGAPWLPGAALGPTEVMRSGGKLRRPSGLSTDDRTLFYWDEVSNSEKAAWRPTATALFDTFVDLGQRRNAAPTGACARLYYGAPAVDGGSGGAITIMVADKQ